MHPYSENGWIAEVFWDWLDNFRFSDLHINFQKSRKRPNDHEGPDDINYSKYDSGVRGDVLQPPHDTNTRCDKDKILVFGT